MKRCITAGKKIRSCVVCMIDATGSMEEALKITKSTIQEVFEAADTYLDDNNLKSAFEMQFVVYRNYSSKELILQKSNWSSEPSTLFTFLDEKGFHEGGQGYEAIEVAFEHVVHERTNGREITQVILIGDAPPNKRDSILRKKNRNGNGPFWDTYEDGRYASLFDVEDMLPHMVDSNGVAIPIQAFYVDSDQKRELLEDTKQVFGRLAERTHGECFQFDVKNKKKVIDLITRTILYDTTNRNVNLSEAEKESFKKLIDDRFPCY